MSPHQHSVCVWVGIHRLLQAFSEILLERGVVNDRNPQRVVVAVIPFALSLGDAFDLLDIADLKVALLAEVALDQQCHQHCPLRVGVNTAAGALVKGGKEERGAIGGLQIERLANVFPRRWRIFGRWVLQDEHVVRLEHFLLDARGRDENVLSATDGGL